MTGRRAPGTARHGGCGGREGRVGNSARATAVTAFSSEAAAPPLSPPRALGRTTAERPSPQAGRKGRERVQPERRREGAGGRIAEAKKEDKI